MGTKTPWYKQKCAECGGQANDLPPCPSGEMQIDKGGTWCHPVDLTVKELRALAQKIEGSKNG